MNQQQLNFITACKAPSLATETTYGVPAEVTLAQAILESATSAGWGTSTLYLQAKNPFGIKLFEPSYGEFDVQTWEIVNGQREDCTAAFQKFPTLDAAFLAHGQLLTTPRYAPAMAHKDDWQAFAEALSAKSSPQDDAHCGYSTNPAYGDTLIQIVEGDNLSAFLRQT